MNQVHPPLLIPSTPSLAMAPPPLPSQSLQNFSRVYPQLSGTLSYTKIRRIRFLLAEVGRASPPDAGSKEMGCLGLEACTVALAYVARLRPKRWHLFCAALCADCIMPALSFNYFDRLVLKNVVNKGNRRAVAGAGLFAAPNCNSVRYLSQPTCRRLPASRNQNQRRFLRWLPNFPSGGHCQPRRCQAHLPNQQRNASYAGAIL